MSAHKRPVSLTPEARQDFRSILVDTRRRWGKEQRDRYHGLLAHSLEELSLFPEIGPERPDYFDGCRVRIVQQHIIYYQIVEQRIRVIRILHERVDAGTLFTNPTS